MCVCEIGWRTRSSWWDESIGCSSEDLEQSTQFLDVDWWESKFLLLLFCWLMNCLSKLYKLCNLKIIDNRQRSSHLGFKRSHLRALVETVNWWWLQSTGCRDTKFPWKCLFFVAEMSDPILTTTPTLKIVYLLYHLEFGYWLGHVWNSFIFHGLLLLLSAFSWTLNLNLSSLRKYINAHRHKWVKRRRGVHFKGSYHYFK